MSRYTKKKPSASFVSQKQSLPHVEEKSHSDNWSCMKREIFVKNRIAWNQSSLTSCNRLQQQNSVVVAAAFPRNASQSNKNLDLLQSVIRVAASFSCPDLDCFHIPTSTWTTAVWLMPNSSWTVTNTTAVPDRDAVDTWPLLLTPAIVAPLEAMLYLEQSVIIS